MCALGGTALPPRTVVRGRSIVTAPAGEPGSDEGGVGRPADTFMIINGHVTQTGGDIMTTEEEPESNKHYWRTKWSALSESYEKQRQELHELKELQSQHKTRIEKKYKEAAAASSRQYEGVCERLGEERNLVSRQVGKIEGLEKELELAQANVRLAQREQANADGQVKAYIHCFREALSQTDMRETIRAALTPPKKEEWEE